MATKLTLAEICRDLKHSLIVDMPGVAMSQPNGTHWYAIVRKQYSHNEFLDIFLSTPTLSAMEHMLRIYKPYSRK